MRIQDSGTWVSLSCPGGSHRASGGVTGMHIQINSCLRYVASLGTDRPACNLVLQAWLRWAGGHRLHRWVHLIDLGIPVLQCIVLACVVVVLCWLIAANAFVFSCGGTHACQYLAIGQL